MDTLTNWVNIFYVTTPKIGVTTPYSKCSNTNPYQVIYEEKSHKNMILVRLIVLFYLNFLLRKLQLFMRFLMVYCIIGVGILNFLE